MRTARPCPRCCWPWSCSTGCTAERFEQFLVEAEEEFTVEADEWGHAVVAFVRLQNYIRRGDLPRSRAMGRTASEAFRRLDDGWGLSAVLYHLGWGLKEFGRYAESVPVLEQAIEVSSSAGVFNTAQWALSDLGVALLNLGERAAAGAAFNRASAASLEVGDAAGVVLAGLGQATIAQMDGDPTAARPLFERAVQGLKRLQTPLWGGHALAGVAWCDWREELFDDALQRYTQVHAAGQQHGEPTLLATGLEGLARVALARGGAVESATLLRQAGEIRRRSFRPAPPHELVEIENVRTQAAAHVRDESKRRGTPVVSINGTDAERLTSP